jgi:ABC-type multidrug transport system ATPase subunit
VPARLPPSNAPRGSRSARAGAITLLGADPGTAGAELRARVGVMLQDGGLPPSARPIPLLRHIAGMYRNPRPLDELVQRLGIDTFSRTNVRRLSGGQKQRLALAAALIGNPEVLFLDEPSAGLDPQSRQLVFELIAELRDSGMGIILTTHLMDDAQRLADYVYIIDAGRNVAEGTVAQLLQHNMPESAPQGPRPDAALRGAAGAGLHRRSARRDRDPRDPFRQLHGHRRPDPRGPCRADRLVGTPRHHAGLAEHGGPQPRRRIP